MMISVEVEHRFNSSFNSTTCPGQGFASAKNRKPTVVLAGHVPVVSLSAAESKMAKTSGDDGVIDAQVRARRQADASASPAVDAAAATGDDFDAMARQLDAIVGRFEGQPL